MIRTGQSRAPWHWVVLLCLICGVATLIESCVSGNPMGLLLSKFTVHPIALTLIGQIAPMMSLLISPYVSWKSDRIWTPWGRRKPFILAGFAVAAVALCVTPFVNNIWILVVLIIFLYVGNDTGYEGPFAPLLYEVVPKSQRGRTSVLKKYGKDLMKLIISVLLLRQWDNVYHFGPPAPAGAAPAPVEAAASLPADGGHLYHIVAPFGFQLTGVHVLYLTVAAIVVITWFFIAFGIEETKPEQALPRESFNVVRFLIDLFRDRQMIMVAILLFCGTTLSVALTGFLTTVMLKTQFHYTAKDISNIAFWTQLLLTVCVLPVAMFISDRVDRRQLYRWGLLLGTLHHLAMWLAIKWLVVPSVSMWIVMIGLGYLVDITAGLALEPLVFDMVPKDKMGTINSGFLLISKILGMIIGPMIGFFIWCYSFAANGWSQKELQWDYSSGFLVYFALGSIGCVLYFVIIEPQWRSGNLTDLGGSAPGPKVLPVAPALPIESK